MKQHINHPSSDTVSLRWIAKSTTYLFLYFLLYSHGVVVMPVGEMNSALKLLDWVIKAAASVMVDKNYVVAQHQK